MLKPLFINTIQQNGRVTGLIFLAILITFSPVSAQKRKKAKSQVEPISKKISSEKRAELEHYFVEAEKFFMLKDYPRAYESFQKVLEIDPSNAAANYKSAQILSENKENRKALQYAIAAKNQDDKNKYYYILLASIYTNIADLDNAIATYSEMLEKVSGVQRHLFDLAALQLYQKQYDDALVTYEKAKQHFGTIEEITYQKQQIYLKQNKLDLAIEEGRQLIESNPSEAMFTISLAQILMANDKLEESKKLLETYTKGNGNNDRVNVLLAEIYRKSGATASALNTLKPVFESNSTSAISKVRTLAGYMSLLPNENLEEGLIGLAEKLTKTHPDSHQAFALTGDLYFNLGQKLKAKNNYVKSVTLDGSNYNIWQNILSLEMELEHYDDAIKHAAQALEIFPNQAALYYFGGSAYLIKKEYGEAIKVLNVGKFYTSSDPNLRSIFFGQLGDAYNGLGNHKKSDSSFDEALKTKPDNDHVLNNYSYFLSLRKEKLEQALDMSSQLVKKHPNNPTYLDTHAWVLYMMQDFDTAKTYLEKAIEEDPSSTIIEHYGDVLFQLGDVEEAIIQWKKAREGSGDLENLNKKIANKQLYE